jgi:hypothetical protein
VLVVVPLLPVKKNSLPAIMILLLSTFAKITASNDKNDTKYFAINNKNDIVLSDIKDTDGNNIDFSGITGPIKLSNTSLDSNLTISADKRITLTNGVYEKTSDVGWNTDVASSKSFTGDGYVIAKIENPNKRLMFGLSSGNTSTAALIW